MLYLVLSYICRTCIFIAFVAPIVAIEAIFDNPIAFLVGTVIAIGICCLCFRLDFYLEDKANAQHKDSVGKQANEISSNITNSNAA